MCTGEEGSGSVMEEDIFASGKINVFFLYGLGVLENCMFPVVRRVNNAVHWIAWLVLLMPIHWILIYPMHIFIHFSYNRGLG